MKRIILFFSIALVLIIASCSKDDDLGNVPPSEVSNIVAEVQQGTNVKISWDPSTDQNNDKISYDVVVNNKVVANKTEETFIDLNILEFIAAKEANNKAASTELTISIKAYDTNNSVSDEVEVKKEVFVNIPPGGVFNIGAEVIEGTMVKVSWDPSKDLNNDVLSYDVVINDKVIATKTPETFVELDTKQFLEQSNKGSKLDLVIKIKAYDTDNSVSDEVEMSTSIFVNRTPGVFDFVDVRFDVNSYDWVEISWSPASDEDGDILAYDVYFNDKIISKDYVIGSNNVQGSFYYNENYAQNINDDIVIKVVANDKSGGKTEISKTFNFKATDVDLGELALPYESTTDIEIVDEEPDNKIGYSFVITETTGYAIQSDISGDFILRNDQGDLINRGSTRIYGETLPPDTYYLEVRKYYYNTADTSGLLTIVLKDPKATDVDLGLLAVPNDQSIDFSISNTETDNKIGYTFQISEQTGFAVFSESGIDFILKDSEGNSLNSRSRRIVNESLSAGTYYLEIQKYYYNSATTGTFTLILNDPKASDQDLGLLVNPYTSSVDFDIVQTEIDNKIAYNFELNATTGYSFSTNSNVYINIYDATGNYINGGYRNIIGALDAGTYYFEVYNNYNSNTAISGTVAIVLDDPKASDIALGELTAPYNQSFSYDTTTEVDRKIGYEFSISASADYSFDIISPNYDAYIYLYDSLGNLIGSSDYGAITGTLTAGTYYVEAAGYSSRTGAGTLSLDLQ